MKDLELKNIDLEQFKKEVYSYYLEIFPSEERKSLKLIEECYNKKYTNIIEILYKNKIVGFMIVNRVKDNGYVILDYFAILPEYRNNKLGTESLRKLLELEEKTRGIFIEIEKIGLGKNEEENLLRERRRNFYERLGTKKLSFDLFLFDVIFSVYVLSNEEINEKEVFRDVLDIYESTLGKKKIEQNIKILRS